MATRRLSVGTTVSGDPARAVDFLADPPRHVGPHPFLVSVTVVDSCRDDGAPWWDYEIVERPSLWRLRYTMRVGNGCVLVSGETTVTAPLPVVDYMTRNARTAHARTFELLASHLAGDP